MLNATADVSLKSLGLLEQGNASLLHASLAPNVEVKPLRACALSFLGDQLSFARLPCEALH